MANSTLHRHDCGKSVITSFPQFENFPWTNENHRRTCHFRGTPSLSGVNSSLICCARTHTHANRQGTTDRIMWRRPINIQIISSRNPAYQCSNPPDKAFDWVYRKTPCWRRCSLLRRGEGVRLVWLIHHDMLLSEPRWRRLWFIWV